MTVAKRLSKIRNPLVLLVYAKRNSCKQIQEGTHYIKCIFIDGSSIEIRFYHTDLLVKVSNR